MNWRNWPRFIAVAVTIAATVLLAAGAASFAIAGPNYGWGLFVGVPFFVGLFSTTIHRHWGPRSLPTCLLVATLAGCVLSFGFLVLGKEGLICILLSVPLALPFILLGAVIGYVLVHRATLVSPAKAALLFVLGLALCIWGETTATRKTPVYEVSDEVSISATPEAVWQSLIALETLPSPHDWIFRTGIACPLRTEIRGSGVGAIRICTLSTGELNERITVWQPGRRLAWTALSTPPPLKEINPFVETDPPHLHGFFRSLTGGFELRPMADGNTLVTRSSTYQHNLYPASYWRFWCDYAVSRGHLYVLGVIKTSAEAERTSVVSNRRYR